ncbi:MAG: hypothetical protein JNK72_12455 [Myxococcales bacterium]|nr:hypothetical protein [Myxococcales bacterium]
MRTALAMLAVAALVAGGYFFNAPASAAAPSVSPESGSEAVVVRPSGEYNPTPVVREAPPEAPNPGGGCGGH